MTATISAEPRRFERVREAFIIGFTAAYSMFLSAIRYRTFADATSRNAMAAASQMGEIYLDSGTEPGTTPMKPISYCGDGDATFTPANPYAEAFAAMLSLVWFNRIL